jgi:hypothetical protein
VTPNRAANFLDSRSFIDETPKGVELVGGVHILFNISALLTRKQHILYLLRLLLCVILLAPQFPWSSETLPAAPSLKGHDDPGCEVPAWTEYRAECFVTSSGGNRNECAWAEVKEKSLFGFDASPSWIGILSSAPLCHSAGCRPEQLAKADPGLCRQAPTEQ